MAEDAKTEKKNNKLIAGIIAAFVIIAGVIVAALLINRSKVIDDDFFKSDDTKYVLSQDFGLNGATKTHTVIYYDKDDNITKWENYLEYDDAEAAKSAFETVKNTKDEESGITFSINGRYVISEYPKETYENTSASTYGEWFKTLDEERKQKQAEETEADSEEAEE